MNACSHKHFYMNGDKNITIAKKAEAIFTFTKRGLDK
jgi:hypothetical protein